MKNQILTDKQKIILQFLKDYLKTTSQSPTISEIMAGVNLKSKATVSEHLGALEKKGYIRKIPGAFRGIIINQEDEGSVELPAVEIQLKGRVAAGNPIEAVEEYETITIPRKLIPNNNRNYFALEIVGDSMQEDGIYDGEIAIIEPQQFAENGDLVVARDEDGNVTLKYFYKEFNRIRLEPRNKNFKPIYLDQCEIIGLLRGVTKKSIELLS